ncbi:hypothetical protein [Amycolatopsis sp. cmx-11-12]
MDDTRATQSTHESPLRRPPTREVHAAWRRSAEASPAIRAVLAELQAA